MTIRKLSAFVPSALVVAVGAHVAATGLGHAPGGNGAGTLLAWIGAWLAMGLSSAFLSGLLGTRTARPGTANVRPSIATRRRRAYGVVALALGGTVAYAAVELAEGHLAAGGLLRALVASLPLAAIVAHVARTAGSAAVQVGTRLGRLAEKHARPADAPFEPARHDRRFARGRLALFSGGGRAPPLFA
jgi:hypothetical protein